MDELIQNHRKFNANYLKYLKIFGLELHKLTNSGKKISLVSTSTDASVLPTAERVGNLLPITDCIYQLQIPFYQLQATYHGTGSVDKVD